MANALPSLASRGGQASCCPLSWAAPLAPARPAAARRRGGPGVGPPTRPRLGDAQVVSVIPMLGPQGRRAPPDLASFLLKERIVYLGMSLVPSVTELLVAEMLWLQYTQPTKPIYMYINSAGVTKSGGKLGYEVEALAIYDTMRHIKPPVRTLCVGTAYGEAAILLAAGEKGTRAALPSASIQLRQPMQRFTQMQASDVDIQRQELRRTKAKLWSVLALHTGRSPQALDRDLVRPRYMNPYDAVNYGIIDRVLAPGVSGAPTGAAAGKPKKALTKEEEARAAAADAAAATTREMVLRSSFSTGLFDEVSPEAGSSSDDGEGEDSGSEGERSGGGGA